MRVVSPEIVRATIARAMLDDPSASDECVGTITLRPHQRNAASRLYEMLTEHGGVMLADRVGLGKTYVAIAVAARLRVEPLLVIPSALQEMWQQALAASRIEGRLVTHEALSRGTQVNGAAGLIIVDEAHRFRSPQSRRYAALADACRTARVLLLTATPVQNSQADLSAQLALFLGRRAWFMREDELASFVIRGTDEPAGLPRLDGPHLVAISDDGAWLDRLLELPPPLPARDEGLAIALLAYGLVHQWSSSRAALIAALQRRRARAVALSAALADGRSPSRAELSAWTYESDAVQLAFAELVSSTCPEIEDLEQMRTTVERHRVAVDGLVRDLRAAVDPDVARADALRRIRASHVGERVLAFCQYTETASALGHLLERDGGIATLTARGARIASGRLSRTEVLAQFQPGREASQTGDATRIDVLIATDLLSEGLNLQEASVVVHLDLPWNPARLEQRVGRVHRIGSRHERVTVYAFAPPTPAERLLAIEHRLAAKLRDAQRTVGVAGRILPSISSMFSPARSPAEQQSELRASLALWRATGSADDSATHEPCIAGVRSDRSGVLACIDCAGTRRLVAVITARVTTESSAIRELILHAGGSAAALDDERCAQPLAQLEAWIDTQRGAAAVDLAAASAARARRLALARVAQALARAPRHRRAQLASLADAARAVATAPLGEGAERILETLVSSELPDEAWLRSIAVFGALNSRTTGPEVRSASGRMLAILILVPSPAARL